MDSYRQEVEQFEVIKADWQMEKESLEGVVMKLRQELKMTRDEKQSAAHIRQVLKKVFIGVTIYEN